MAAGTAAASRLGSSNPDLRPGSALQNRGVLPHGTARLDASLAAQRSGQARRDGAALLGRFERARHCPALFAA